MKISLPLCCLFLAGTARAELVTLLRCDLGYAPVSFAEVVDFMGGLHLLTRDRDGVLTRRGLADKEWEQKIFTVLNQDGMRGVLYRNDGQWYYRFKGEHQWEMAGNASCYLKD